MEAVSGAVTRGGQWQRAAQLNELERLGKFQDVNGELFLHEFYGDSMGKTYV